MRVSLRRRTSTLLNSMRLDSVAKVASSKTLQSSAAVSWYLSAPQSHHQDRRHYTHAATLCVGGSADRMQLVRALADVQGAAVMQPLTQAMPTRCAAVLALKTDFQRRENPQGFPGFRGTRFLLLAPRHSPRQNDVFEVAHAVGLMNFGAHVSVRDGDHLSEHHLSMLCWAFQSRAIAHRCMTGHGRTRKTQSGVADHTNPTRIVG